MKVVLISIEESPSLIFPVMMEMLRERGHDCKYIHIPLSKYNYIALENVSNQIIETISDIKLIGVSCMTNTFIACRDLVKKLKERTKAKVIIGGVHPTIKPEESLKFSDFVCVGEGEYALLELVERLKKNKKVDNIKNIYIKYKEKMKRNKMGPLVKNLNELPVPKFNLKNIYFWYKEKLYCLDERKDLLKIFYKKYYYIMASRGCPYRCKYCLNDALINLDPQCNIIRRRESIHVIQELKNLLKVYKEKIIIGFVDDDFCAQPEERLEEFLKLYKKEINLPFFAASTPTSMSPKKIKMLVDAGMIRLEIGVQSISDKINHEVFGRFSTRKDIEKTIDMIKEYRKKVEICYDFILDNPWEKEDTLIESLNFIFSIPKPATINLFSLTLYPGTGLYCRACEEGIITNDYRDVYTKNHMLLKNDSINTLFVLYTKYKFPKLLIKTFLELREIGFCKKIFEKMTHPLWRAHNYYAGFKDAIERRDKDKIKYFLKAPFLKILKK